MAVYAIELPEIRDAEARRAVEALPEGALLSLAREADESGGKSRVVVQASEQGPTLGAVPSQRAFFVARNLADDRDVAVRLRTVQARGWLWWRRVTVEVDILTADDARKATGVDKRRSRRKNADTTAESDSG